MHPTTGTAERGFTLIELSIVLVVIGLIVGGVLVGQSLINAAAVRAQVTQIEKFNTAANTFFQKYGYLPGDIPDPSASSFGFQARGIWPGEGDGNGILQGRESSGADADGRVSSAGENAMFWVDLSTAGLIDQTFNTASPSIATNCTNAVMSACFPTAKISGMNYIYVFSGGWYNSNWISSGVNYFGISSATSLAYNGVADSKPMLTVQQALAIDSKMDDGLPQSGNVIAVYLNMNLDTATWSWAAGGGLEGAHAYNTSLASPNIPSTAATSGSSTTCYDNGGSSGTQKYSVEISNGANVNCALSFKMQAGD